MHRLNVFGEPLKPCGSHTGFTRNGFCNFHPEDGGSHTVCAVVTKEFIKFTYRMGNDLITPRPPHFPGLKPGDRWCLCVLRWLQAHKAGKAPPIILEATDISVLEYVTPEILSNYAV